MYSVEDLLISHGYKLPKHTTSSSTPTPDPVSSSCQGPSSSPPSYNKHHEVLENRPGPRAVNGYDRGPGMPYGNGGGPRQPQAFGSGCPNNNNNNEPRDRGLSRREGEIRCQIDTHSLGESLTSDSGFCDGTRGPQSQFKDVSYWRRRGQDFTVLLDCADLRETHGGGHRGYGRLEGSQQARGQELSSAEERQRAAQERQRWAAQAQVQAQVRSREREAALHHWRMVNERKCQSLGTDEWRPAVNFGRQLSQSEGEHWAQEQQRLHARTPEGMVVHPRAKAKSQSLPRMLQPESLQYVDIDSSGLELFRRVNGHPLSHYDLYRPPRWPENGRPASANQLSMTPKPRFTRPPRPPSYEMHQQIRGSCEMLSGRDSVILQARDRTPLPILRTGDSQLDYFAQDSGPPGYIPPPSYTRAPIMGGGHRGYGEIAVDYRYRGDVYQQLQVAPDASHWFTRHPAGSWPDPQREMSMKQLYPVYTTQERPGGGIQYISFDDPRIRHISSTLRGNSLTDANKIRHIRNELPSVTVSEPASSESAFLPPPLGPFIAAKLADDANQTSSSGFDNDNNRWHKDLSNLCEVKYAKGIPENESIEQRAARILGIAVPVESLGVADNQDGIDTYAVEKLHSQGEETQQVIGECQLVNYETQNVQGAETEEVKGRESGGDHKEGDRQKHSSNHSDGEDTEIQSSLVVLDLPEFLPQMLPLSLPVHPEDKLPLSTCSVERRGQGGACKLIESLQDRLTSFAAASVISLDSYDPSQVERV
ncbi:Junctional protein associated with coronary artery disease [Liparis tanakae]|uniref:Junctional protein associated with coronary artery disease n=1 Tax=Liparis tanakae TaxID=230148 RepID=A0A4Z2GVQ0_9TELE|nr:Junctional protein associated with coronary artery disease [Liparis tanakae]